MHPVLGILIIGIHPRNEVFMRGGGDLQGHYRSLAINKGQIVTLFSLSNLWMARKKLLISQE